MNWFITAEDLRKLEPAPLIFDLRFRLADLAYHDQVYAEGHIPGAFLVDFERDLSDPEGDFGGDHPFLQPEAFANLLEKYGARDDSLLVLYDESSLMSAARFIYQAKFSGLACPIRILKGGYEAWLQAGGETERDLPKAPGGGALTIAPAPELICRQDTVKAQYDDPTSLLIDSRSPERYRGETEPRYPVAGHIPGAVNYYYEDILIDGALKDTAFLEAHFADLKNYDDIILSCGSGGTACVNSLGLDMVGIPHRIYNGSYSDWIKNPDNKVNTGDKP